MKVTLWPSQSPDHVVAMFIKWPWVNRAYINYNYKFNNYNHNEYCKYYKCCIMYLTLFWWFLELRISLEISLTNYSMWLVWVCSHSSLLITENINRSRAHIKSLSLEDGGNYFSLLCLFAMLGERVSYWFTSLWSFRSLGLCHQYWHQSSQSCEPLIQRSGDL